MRINISHYYIRYYVTERDNLAKVKANTFTPFDMSSILENSSGLWLYPAKATTTRILIKYFLYKDVSKNNRLSCIYSDTRLIGRYP